jgi:CBS domain containing-hemolysin-like protein
MTFAVVLFIVAVLISAFFSGAETGFYRMTRLRLVMEAKTGDRTSRMMLWLANQPSLFVATTLIGTNIGHELASAAIVLGAEHLFPGGVTTAEFVGTLLLAPVLFIAGDLMPKNLFYLAPNRLMRRCSPALIVCVFLFAPITAALWLLSTALRVVARQAGPDLRLSLARRELNEMLVEGHESGLLRPVQRTLAQTMLSIAPQPIKNFAAPAGRVVRGTTTMTKSELLRIAQRHRRHLLPIEDTHDKRKLVGFVRTIDLFLDNSPEPPVPTPLVELAENESILTALEKLIAADDALGHVVGPAGKTVGFVTTRELRGVLLGS